MPEKKVLINDWENGLRAVEHERASGKKRVTLDVKSDVLVANLDPLVLGRDIAEAIAVVIREGIQAINAPAAPATVLKRKYAKAALNRGAGWAVRRYSGGRTGTIQPDSAPGDRLFNDSGRLARTVVAGPTKEGDWKVNCAVNRLSEATFAPGAFVIMLERLVAHVPVLRDPSRLGQAPQVIAAMERTAEHMVTKGDHRAAEVLAQLAQFGGHVGGIADAFDAGQPAPEEEG